MNTEINPKTLETLSSLRDSFERVSNIEAIRASYAKLQQQELGDNDRSIDHIFFEQGFTAWLVLQLARYRGTETTHRTSDTSRYRTAVEDLCSANPEALASIARQLVRPTTRQRQVKIDRVQRGLESASQAPGAKRRRGDLYDAGRHSPTRDAVSAGTGVASDPMPDLTPQAVGGGSLAAHSAPLSPLLFTVAADNAIFHPAKLDRVPNVFDARFADCINRIKNGQVFAADIKMDFSDTLVAQAKCRMLINVLPSQVQSIAERLFGVRIETLRDHRRICFPSTTTVVIPSPVATIGGKIALDRVALGPSFQMAVEGSPEYESERAQWFNTTECLLMDVPAGSQEPATIRVCMGMWQGTLIKEMLYK